MTIVAMEEATLAHARDIEMRENSSEFIPALPRRNERELPLSVGFFFSFSYLFAACKKSKRNCSYSSTFTLLYYFSALVAQASSSQSGRRSACKKLGALQVVKLWFYFTPY